MRIQSIGGELINSYQFKAKRAERAPSEIALRIATAVPFWPETISTNELVAITGMHYAAVVSRIYTIQETFRIFDHNGRWSRLNDDLSNIEEGEEDA